MTRKLQREEYKQASDTVSADDIEDAAIVTITAFEDGDRKDEKGKWAMLKFEQTGDKVFWLTDAGFDALFEKLGDDADKWIGKDIPVEKYNTKNGPRVRIMAAKEWAQAFKDAAKAPARGKKR